MINLKNSRLKFISLIAFLLFCTEAIADRFVDESIVLIKGEQRRYYRVHDSEPLGNMPVILFIGGSGCSASDTELPLFFKKYPTSLLRACQ